MKIDGDPNITPFPGSGFNPIPSLEPPAERRRKDKEGRIERGRRKERGEKPIVIGKPWEGPAEGRPEKGGRNRRKGGIDFGNITPFGGLM